MLSLHELTDEIPTRSDIAILRGAQPITVYQAPTAWHRFDADTFDIGRGEYALPGGLSIGLYSPERTLIDLFRLRHAWGSDLALSALPQWLHGRGNSPGGLLALAENSLKARPAIQHALEVLLWARTRSAALAGEVTATHCITHCTPTGTSRQFVAPHVGS